MPVTSRRSKKKAAPAPVVYEDDDDDEEEEEEDDFVPGQDDDEDEDDEDDEEDEDDVAGILEGHLSYEEDVLHYRGETFHLTVPLTTTSGTTASKDAQSPVWNPLRDPPPSSGMATYQMKGTIKTTDSESTSSSSGEEPLPQRVFDITWTTSRDGAPLGLALTGKKTPDNDSESEEDGKQKASPKRPALFYNLTGSEVVNAEATNVLIKFKGGFYPSPGVTSVPLNCQFQYCIPETRHSVAERAAPMVAVAAAAAAAHHNTDNDEDDADEAMNYNELIALHEDANLNVEELKRRYQSGADDDSSPNAKKQKAAPKPDDDDDDDDDVGF